MPDVKDIEYLARPILDDVVFIIEDDYVKISSSHTLYIENRRIVPVAKKEILALYESVLHKAKSRNAKISFRNHYRRAITKCWPEYMASCARATAVFENMIEQSKVVQARGLHSGTIDDSALAQLSVYRSEYNGFFYRGSIVSKISDIYRDLQESNDYLDDPRYDEFLVYL